jgi:HEAT repeat protein
VRQTAAKALAQIKDSRAVEPLMAALKDGHGDVRKAAAEALGEIGDMRAIAALVAALPDWHSRRALSKALLQLGWQPQTEREQVYLWIGGGQTQELTENWEKTRRLLLEDVRSANTRLVENAVYTFVSLGREEVVPELVSILDTHENKEMAETFLNCGHKTLAEAARGWATRKGYTVMPFGSGGQASWGNWR